MGNGALTPFLIYDQEANFHQDAELITDGKNPVCVEACKPNETTGEYARIPSVARHASRSGGFGVDQHKPDSHSLCRLASGGYAHPRRVLVCA